MPAVSGKLRAGQVRAHIFELAIYPASDCHGEGFQQSNHGQGSH
jgi:hypothetical protein